MMFGKWVISCLVINQLVLKNQPTKKQTDYNSFLNLATGIFICSRYLATVLLAML